MVRGIGKAAVVVITAVTVDTEAFAEGVPERCYDLYYSFIDSETWEGMGIAARLMDDEGCWLPVSTSELHSEGEELDVGGEEVSDTSPREPRDFATSCTGLAPHIVSMSERQDDTPIIKILGPKDANSTELGLTWTMMDLERALIGLQPIHSPVSPTKRTLNCIGAARFQGRGQSRIQFWLDRDPDGEEFIVYQTVN